MIKKRKIILKGAYIRDRIKEYEEPEF